jgi:membrane-associated phospholipid phosphatase
MGLKNYLSMLANPLSLYISLYDKILSMQIVVWAESEPVSTIVALGVSGIEWLWLLVLVSAHLWALVSRSSIATVQVRIQLIWSLVVDIVGVVVLMSSVYIAKWYFAVARPYELFAFGIGNGLLDSYGSFPSAHAALFTYVTCIVYAGVRSQILKFIGLCALAIVVSARVGAGYHYISDVVIGCLLGVIAYEVTVYLQRNKANRLS